MPTTDFLNIFLFRNSAAAVAGFLFISRPPAKLLKYFLETLASFRPARLPASPIWQRAALIMSALNRPIKTQTRNAHSGMPRAVCLWGRCLGGRGISNRAAQAPGIRVPVSPHVHRPRGSWVRSAGLFQGPACNPPARPPPAAVLRNFRKTRAVSAHFRRHFHENTGRFQARPPETYLKNP